MKKKTKQIVAGIIANILFIPPILMVFYFGKYEVNWLHVFYSFLPLFVSLLFLKILWGRDMLRDSIWEEEGFSSFSEWYANSQTFNGKFFRISIKMFIPSIILAGIILGIIFL